MGRNLIFTLLVYVALITMSVNAYALSKTAKVTLVVVDEAGVPLEGVNVGVSFEKNTSSGATVTPKSAITDKEGKASFSGSCNGNIAYGSEQEGYYSSYYTYDFNDIGFGGWKPSNPELKIVFRKIENPVPMYARQTNKHKHLEIPELNKDIGFDLIVFDWVDPYGKGKVSDFVFNLKRDSQNIDEFKSELTMTFTNESDGLTLASEDLRWGSVFKLSRHAPDIGYSNQLVQTVSRVEGQWFKTSYHAFDNYYFRVRSAMNDNRVVKSMYGKIVGPIAFYPGRSKKTALLDFQYILNPEGTRNLEFDTSKNLFGELPNLERVNNP